MISRTRPKRRTSSSTQTDAPRAKGQGVSRLHCGRGSTAGTRPGVVDEHEFVTTRDAVTRALTYGMSTLPPVPHAIPVAMAAAGKSRRGSSSRRASGVVGAFGVLNLSPVSAEQRLRRAVTRSRKADAAQAEARAELRAAIREARDAGLTLDGSRQSSASRGSGSSNYSTRPRLPSRRLIRSCFCRE
jgi:hypothetical protein